MINNTSTPPDFLSPSVATELSELDAEEIRAVLDYVESLSNARSKPASMIEAGPSEEIVSIEDHETHNRNQAPGLHWWLRRVPTWIISLPRAIREIYFWGRRTPLDLYWRGGG